MIENIKLCVAQYRGAYDDAAEIYVEMTDEDAEDRGRKVYIRQCEEGEDGDKEHEIFIDGKDALNSLIEALEFIRSRKGWTREERM